MVAAESYKTSDYLAIVEAIEVRQQLHRIKIGVARRSGWLGLYEVPGFASTSGHQPSTRYKRRARPATIRSISSSPAATTGQPKGAMRCRTETS